MKILFVIITLNISISTFGQKHILGYYGGVTAHNISNKLDFTDRKYLVSITQGLTYIYHYNHKIILSSNVGIVNMGANISIGPSSKISELFRYINFSLLPGYKLTINEKCFFHTSIGLASNFLLSYKLKFSDEEQEDYLYPNFAKKLDLSGLARIGYNTNMSAKLNLDFSFQFSRSLFPIYIEGNFSEDFKPFHYGGILSIGLHYKL